MTSEVEILWQRAPDGNPDAEATARHYCGLYRVSRLAAVRARQECEQLRDEIANQNREIEHWQRMYECAQNANAFRADALDETLNKD